MVNLTSSLPSEDYIEECHFGEDLQVGCFYPGNSKFCLLSNNSILEFDAATGRRLHAFRHFDAVIGVNVYNNLLISFTTASEIYVWEMESRLIKGRSTINIPDGYRVVWTYELNEEIYLLAVRVQMDEKRIDEDSLLVCFTLRSLFTDAFDQINDTVQARAISYTGRRPGSKKCLTIGDGFYVKSEGKLIKMVEFGKPHFADNGIASSSNGCTHLRKSVKSEVFMKFKLKSHFQVNDQSLVLFDGVYISGETLIATVNSGRIYSWQNVTTSGLSFDTASHITLTGHQVEIAMTPLGTLFIGAGNGLLFKYNVTGTSGAGRWSRLAQLSLDCPTRALMFNSDFTILVAILIDNSVSIIRTSVLNIIAKAEVVKASKTNWIGLSTDPANPKRIVANSRIGFIQLIDIDKWITVFEADISEENISPEDTFNRPDFLWLDVYLVNMSIPRIVTCECRRNDPEKTYLKIWRRCVDESISEDERLEMEDFFVFPRRVSFVRSTLDEFWDKSSITFSQINSQQFLLINSAGEMDVLFRDKENGNHWSKDVKRHDENWQGYRVLHCSNIRNGQFATVNVLGNKSYVLLWNLMKLSISKLIDKLKNVVQVEWTPQSSVLLIACQFGIVSYDSDSCTILWAVLKQNMSISSNHLATFAYDEHFVFVINPMNGIIERNSLKFSKEQKWVVSANEGGNVWYIGMSGDGSLTCLKPGHSQNAAPCKSNAIEEDGKVGSTAFSRLMAMEQNGGMKRKRRAEDGREEWKDELEDKVQPLLLMGMPSINRFLDGPSHSLPPITQLARQFVQACLVRRNDRY